MLTRIGQQLGNYRLISLLGTGGFAEVYLGEHVHLESRTALSEEHQAAFLTEARRLVRLRHPHIVRLLDFGIEGDTPFLVMDYAPNGSLRTRHPKGSQVDLETVVVYVKQVANALQYIHDQKLVHRDVKPENMLLGANDEVLLSDLGVAAVAYTTESIVPQRRAGTLPI
jgi:eukaryotic-like serine/threonine-protein kinase